MKKKFLFSLLIIILLFLNHYTRGISGFYNFIILGFLNIFLTAYLVKLNPFKIVGLVLIFFPLLFFIPNTVYKIINNEAFLIFHSLLYILTSIIGFYYYKINLKYRIIILSIYFVTFFITLYQYENLCYNYYDSFEKVKTNVNFPQINIFDKNKNEISLPKNKIIVIDLWSNSCGNCIKDFPKFQEFSDKYKYNKEVEVFSLNIINNDKDIEIAEKHHKKYTFRNYFTDKEIFKKLGFNGVPNYVIIGKNDQLIYFGHLNTKYQSNKNYFHKIIANELKK